MIVALILLVGIVAGVPLGLDRSGAWRDGNLAERRHEFGPIEREEIITQAVNSQEEEDLWRKERERYAQRERPG